MQPFGEEDRKECWVERRTDRRVKAKAKVRSREYRTRCEDGEEEEQGQKKANNNNNGNDKKKVPGAGYNWDEVPYNAIPVGP